MPLRSQRQRRPPIIFQVGATVSHFSSTRVPSRLTERAAVAGAPLRASPAPPARCPRGRRERSRPHAARPLPGARQTPRSHAGPPAVTAAGEGGGYPFLHGLPRIPPPGRAAPARRCRRPRAAPAPPGATCRSCGPRPGPARGRWRRPRRRRPRAGT